MIPTLSPNKKLPNKTIAKETAEERGTNCNLPHHYPDDTLLSSEETSAEEVDRPAVIEIDNNILAHESSTLATDHVPLNKLAT